MRFLFILFICLASSWSHAYQHVEAVYEALVEIEDRSEAARNRAIRKGLEQVLVRYTGFSGIGNFPELQSELEQAQRYVIEYGVETRPRVQPDGLGVAEGDSLWIRYNSSLIDKLATSLELPIWPTWRPSIDYAVVTELWGEPYRPTESDRPALFLQLERVFRERGLSAAPLSPGELKGIDAADLWNLTDTTAERLRKTSSADITALFRFRPTGNQYSVDLLFISPGAETLMRRQALRPIDALDAGLNAFVDDLSSKLAFLGGTDLEFDLHLSVDGVRSFAQYRTLLDKLAGLEQVVFARLDKVDDLGARFLLRYRSNQSLLIDSITAITGLQPIEEETMDNARLMEEFALPGTEQNPLRFYNPDQDFLPRDSAGGLR